MKLLMLLAVVAIAAAGPAFAADHQILMLNKGEKGAMVFQPDYIDAVPGDTVTFVPTDKGHDAQAIKGMVPEGVELFKGKINQQFTVTLETEGLYGVKCAPHYGMGMVALIKVGQPANLEAASAIKHPGKAKTHFEALLAEVSK